jgi:hypothetical protein
VTVLRLLTFAACEAVIISDIGLASLINVLQHIKVGGESKEPPPEGALVPMKWAAFALWTRETGTTERIDFEQRLEVATPDGQVVMSQDTNAFIERGKRTLQVRSESVGFPVWRAGICEIRLSARQSGREWKHYSTHPIEISHTAPE